MKPYGTLGAILLTVLGFHLALAPAAFAAGRQIICPRVAAAPTLDGRIDEWPPLPQAVMANERDWHPAAAPYAKYGGPSDLSADIRLVWDDRALYAAIETRDDAPVRVRSAAEIDRGDSIVLTLTAEGSSPPPAGSSEVNQFVIALLKGASLVWRAQPAAKAGEGKAIGRAIWARPEQNAGFKITYELAIPWSELVPLRPIIGQEFLLSISACDDDGAGLKGCLEQNLPVIYVADAGLDRVPARPTSLIPRFPKPSMARFDRKSFLFKDRPVLLLGGRIDYSSLPRVDWEGRLALLKAAGMNAVEVTIPWFHHQPGPRRLDLSDLQDFLALCQRVGVWVQLNLGPYGSDDWPAGGVPDWVLAQELEEHRGSLVEGWCRALLPVVKRYQLTADGPIAAVVIRPLPDADGVVPAESLQALVELMRSGGVEAPLLTANAPAARDNTKQSLANLLDTLAFYAPVSAAEVFPKVRALAAEENGPAVVSYSYGGHADSLAARQTVSLVKVALAAGATAISLSDFSPGLNASTIYLSDRVVNAGMLDPAGAHTAGYGELRLVGNLVRLLSTELARAVPAEGVLRCDDPEVHALARLDEKVGFIFIWDEKNTTHRQVRLTYTPPGTTASLSVPEAGAISLPPGCAKVLAMEVPVGRGTLRYSTSEIAALHKVGERTLLALYGDVDTPGEIALRWPGPPLVIGEVTRQRWDGDKNTLILDYFHSHQDQYLLVDDLQIAILSRERAAAAGQIVGASDAITISAGAEVAGGVVKEKAAEAALDCPAGVVQVSAALPGTPTLVTVDGRPAQFKFTTPDRVLTFTIKTDNFEEDTRASGLTRLGQAIIGGPPKLTADFDRGWFRPDRVARGGACQEAASLGCTPEIVGLSAGSFARLRAGFEAPGRARLRITGATDPSLLFLNGKLVPELSGTKSKREADATAYLSPGQNQIEIILDLLPPEPGTAGVHELKRLLEVILVSDQGAAPVANWQVYAGLAGEAEGWTRPDLDIAQWHFLRFRPWRQQGRKLEDEWGVGWYRVPFGLSRPSDWRIPYYLNLALRGTAALYLNGHRFAKCMGDGTYHIPLPASLAEQGGGNILAAAVYGLEPDAGIERIQIAADRPHMVRRRNVVISF